MNRLPNGGCPVDPHTGADLTLGPCGIGGCPTGVDADDQWVSYSEAAEILGCSPTTAAKLVREGQLEHRPGPRRYPSVSRVSTHQLAHDRHAAAANRASRPAARTRSGPPDDGDAWLSAATSAVLLGISSRAVRLRGTAGTMPATRVDRKWWFRRQHVENLAARDAEQRRWKVGSA